MMIFFAALLKKTASFFKCTNGGISGGVVHASGFAFQAPKRVFRRHSCFDVILMYPDVHFLIIGGFKGTQQKKISTSNRRLKVS